MKIYRFVRTKMIQDKVGQSNEYANLNAFNAISPSYPFLRKKPRFVMNFNNTFGGMDQMCKYFFASIFDLLNFIKDQAYALSEEANHFQYIIMEIEIPDEVLQKYIGLGFYSKELSKVEFRIPYQDLYKFTSLEDLDYFQRLLDFYNQNLYQEFLDYTRSYKKFASIPRPKEYYGFQRLDIYSLFCFKARLQRAHLELDNIDTARIEQLGEIAAFYRGPYYGKKINEIVGREYGTMYDPSYEKDKLFNYTSKILEEENEEMKRVLKRKSD